jgi:prepilin-type N-terminal cleavage/methylation domain-containing protein
MKVRKYEQVLQRPILPNGDKMTGMKIKQAFTLIEILVTVSILAILSLLIVQSLFTSLRNNTKAEIMKDLKQNGDNAMQTIVRMIQNADSVACTSGNVLSVTGSDANVTVIDTYTAGDVCRLRSTFSPSPTPLTLTSLNISMKPTDSGNCATAILFTCESEDTIVTKVNIAFTLVQKGAPEDAIDKAEQTFQSSAVVRNRKY